MKKYWVLIKLLGVFVVCVKAQVYPISQISINEGLPQSVVYDIFQDSRGFIWFATQDGVGRFDGIEFHNYSVGQGLADNMARDVSEDALGNIWVGTDNGISIIVNGERGEIVNPELFKGRRVRCLLPQPDSSMWIGITDFGLVNLKNNVITKQYNEENGLISNRIYAIVSDVNGTLYVGTEDGLSIINNNTIKNYTERDGLLSNRIRTFELLDNERLWIAGYGGGVTELSGGTFKQFTTKQGFPAAKINKLIRRADGAIAIATDGDGVYLYKNKSFTHINKIKGLPNQSVQSLLDDKENNLWIGTWGSGAFRLRYLNILHFDNRTGLPENNVTAIAVDKNNQVWMGTNNEGITLFKSDGSRIYFNKNNGNLPVNRIFDLEVDDRNRILAATDRGLFRLSEKGTIQQLSVNDIGRSSVRKIAIDANNRIWAGVFERGLYIIDEEKSIHFSHKNGLLNDSVFAVAHRKNGETWVGSDGGINVFKNDKVIRSITVANGLIDNRITSLMEDSHGNMWVGFFKNGLSIFYPDSIRHVDMSNGLVSNLTTFLVTDNFGSVWVGTKKGINRFYEDKILSYSTTNGIISGETNTNGAYYAHPYLYIGTVEGATRIDLTTEIPNNYPPPVYITSIKNLDKQIDSKSLNHLKYYQNNLTFEFTGINFTNPTQVRYRYRLLGFDDEWRTSDKRSLQFTNLPTGKYVFEVLAQNSFGIFSEKPAQVIFEIIPPFWATFPFRIVIFGLIILTLYIGVRIRDKRLRRLNEELEKQVKERTEELRKSEELFRLITENAGDLIVLCSMRGETVYASPSFEKLLGYHPKEIEGKVITMLTDDENRKIILDVVNRIKQHPEQVITAEVKFRHKNGQWIDFVTTTTTVQSSGSDEMQLIFIGHDISSRKKIEEELIRSKMQAEEANRAKSRFLASMSHELRTPLNAILGFAQIMANASDIPHKHREYVKIMHNSGEHLLSMINDILDLSKIEAGRMELKPSISSLFDFLLDLENMMQIQARKNNLALVFERETEIPDFVELDFNKLRQILINLIGNAIKYTEKGNIWVYIRKMENDLCFEVRDTGPGIEPSQITKIFDAFHQANGNNFSKGTGLGLTISMKLAQLMGGNIRVESTVGKGSTFTLQVPVKVVNQEKILVKNKKTFHIKNVASQEKPPKIMIVDDVDENRIILAEFLSQVGFDCYDFSLAKPALEALDAIQPDIILTDIIMPEMNGKEFLVEIRKHETCSKTPVVAITASIFAETRTDLLQFGFDEFIHKPIDMHHLLDIISKFTSVSYEEEEESQKAMVQSHSTQTLTNELDELSSAQKKQLTEALELLDVDSIQEIVNSLPEHLNLKKQLQLALEEKNYRFILSLSEQLNT